MIKIIRHAFALIREDKLFSAIYIAGTAVAIASAMVIAIVLNIKIADIPPESNRSRTLYVINGFVTDSAWRLHRGHRLHFPQDGVRRGGHRCHIRPINRRR